MATKRCLACGDTFPLRPQSPNQAYCAAAVCQRDRRKHWQRERRRSDHDYRENQTRAHERWLAQRPDYWREYRTNAPWVSAVNLAQDQDRPARNSARRQSMASRCSRLRRLAQGRL